MKQINMYLDESEHDEFLKLKGTRTWKQVLEAGLQQKKNAGDFKNYASRHGENRK